MFQDISPACSGPRQCPVLATLEVTPAPPEAPWPRLDPGPPRPDLEWCRQYQDTPDQVIMMVNGHSVDKRKQEMSSYIDKGKMSFGS